MEWVQGLLRRLDEGQVGVAFVRLTWPTGTYVNDGGLGRAARSTGRRLSRLELARNTIMSRAAFNFIVCQQAAAERYLVAKGKQAQVGGWVSDGRGYNGIY